MDAMRDGLEQMFEKLPRDLTIRLVHEQGDCKLAGPVNAHKEIELTFRSLNLGNVDMEKADGVSLELLPFRLVAINIGQTRDAMPL